jgi:hypothetical protein
MEQNKHLGSEYSVVRELLVIRPVSPTRSPDSSLEGQTKLTAEISYGSSLAPLTHVPTVTGESCAPVHDCMECMNGK